MRRRRRTTKMNENEIYATPAHPGEAQIYFWHHVNECLKDVYEKMTTGILAPNSHVHKVANLLGFEDGDQNGLLHAEKFIRYEGIEFDKKLRAMEDGSF